MAAKKNNAAASASTTTTPSTAPPQTTSTPAKKTTSTSATIGGQQWDNIAQNLIDHYQKTTPQRTKLIDVFMAFLVVVGGLQFLYCILAGNYVCGSQK
jgi:oligosaccharyltransferase complex subunit epsilon